MGCAVFVNKPVQIKFYVFIMGTYSMPKGVSNVKKHFFFWSQWKSSCVCINICLLSNDKQQTVSVGRAELKLVKNRNVMHKTNGNLPQYYNAYRTNGS